MADERSVAPQRYHPALVVLHWLLALMIVFALIMASLKFPSLPNDSPDKLMGLRGHLVAGNAILLLTLIRLVVRWRTRLPAQAPTGSAGLDRLVVFGHYGFYLLTLLMVGSGYVLAYQAAIPAAVFDGTGTLPASFADYAAHRVHDLSAGALATLIAVHVLASFYHHFVRRDGLLGRMGFGRR